MNTETKPTETTPAVASSDFVRRLDNLEMRVLMLEGKPGYICQLCLQKRPPNWFVYEIERDGKWLRPCCAVCARENKSRGPYSPNAEVSDGANHK